MTPSLKFYRCYSEIPQTVSAKSLSSNDGPHEIQQTVSVKSPSSRNLKYMSYFARECPCLQIGQQPTAQLPCGEVDRESQALTQRLKLYRAVFQQYRRIGPTVSDQSCSDLPKDANIFASRYQLYLPSREELKAQLERIEAELRGGE